MDTEQIKAEIDELFGDTTQRPEDTADALKEIQAHCEECLDALRADGVDC